MITLTRQYKNAWTVSRIPYSANVGLRTPSFKPLLNDEGELGFEIVIIPDEENQETTIQLRMLKLAPFTCANTAQLQLRVSLHLDTGYTFPFPSMTNVQLFRMTDAKYNDIVLSDDKQMFGSITVKCKIDFYGDASPTLSQPVCLSSCRDAVQLDGPPSTTIRLGSNKRKAEDLQRFAKNFKSVYESRGRDGLSDFAFLVGKKTFQAHRVVLAAHSPVLMRMLTQDFQESKTNCTTITDTTPEIFELFLKFLYSGSVEERSWSTVKELYYLAEKYDVEILRDECLNIANSVLTVDIICEVLKFANDYHNEKLLTSAKQFAASHIREILPRDDWKQMVANHPIIGYDVVLFFAPV